MTYIEEGAAYVRVSHAEQKMHGISLDAQVAKIKEYAERNNIKIVEWYKDEGVSGRKLIKNRPELQRMIHDAQKGRFKRILFIKLDRYFRSVGEYHECQKLLDDAGVTWTATEEKYDLSTANGRAFVNMKLTVAELEADTTGERIKIVNDYKVKSGLPLFGTTSMPFCYAVEAAKPGEKNKSIVKRYKEFMEDVIAHLLVNRSVRQAVLFANNKHGEKISYKRIVTALRNEMICGSYRGNPNYCVPYIDRQTFEHIQSIIDRNPRSSNNEYTYIFSGLVRCPLCGRKLSGGQKTTTHGEGKKSISHTYRCYINKTEKACDFGLIIFESTLEKKLLERIEEIIEEKEIANVTISEKEGRVPKHNIEELQEELERLNYAWRKGRIKKVEEYDRQYDDLMAQIDAATEEIEDLSEAPDYDHIKAILETGWKGIYRNLDNDHKRAFWRSFIKEINVNWTKDAKEIVDVKFF